jgi:hypothetical protein
MTAAIRVPVDAVDLPGRTCLVPADGTVPLPQALERNSARCAIAGPKCAPPDM